VFRRGLHGTIEWDGSRGWPDTASGEACSLASAGHPVSESVGDSGEEAGAEDAGRASPKGVVIACQEEMEPGHAGKARSPEDAAVARGIPGDEEDGDPGWVPVGRVFALHVDTRQPMLRADRVTASRALLAAHPWPGHNWDGPLL
jgi:hypothetical protein